MGITTQDLRLITDLREAGHLSAGRVIEIGAQQLSDNFLTDLEGIERASAAFGVVRPSLPAPLGEDPHGGMHRAAPIARPFWEALGFEYSCIDIDGTPGAIRLDLNTARVPRRLRERFGLVTNFGTTEHVANQLQAFRIIHDLTIPGGVMIHHVPSQGMMNHGLVNYNPKFFWMLARENNYDWLMFDFRWSLVTREVHPDIIGEMKKFVSPEGRGEFATSDSMVVAALRKPLSRPFRPPIDVPG